MRAISLAFQIGMNIACARSGDVFFESVFKMSCMLKIFLNLESCAYVCVTVVSVRHRPSCSQRAMHAPLVLRHVAVHSPMCGAAPWASDSQSYAKRWSTDFCLVFSSKDTGTHLERSPESLLYLFISRVLQNNRTQTMQKKSALLAKRRNLRSMPLPCIE